MELEEKKLSKRGDLLKRQLQRKNLDKKFRIDLHFRYYFFIKQDNAVKKNTSLHIAVQGRMIAHRDTTLVRGTLTHAPSVSTQDDR